MTVKKEPIWLCWIDQENWRRLMRQALSKAIMERSMSDRMYGCKCGWLSLGNGWQCCGWLLCLVSIRLQGCIMKEKRSKALRITLVRSTLTHGSLYEWFYYAGRKRVFFASTYGDIVSFLIDKAAIDRVSSIETKHHSMQELAQIWVEHIDIVCLSGKSQIEIVRYKSTSKSPRCIDLNDYFFHKGSPFATKITKAIAFTGCSQYLAVALFSNIDKISTICLLERRGRFMSRTTDERKPLFLVGPNTIHRMVFIVFEKHVYLVELNLFTFVSLYLINPRRKSNIIYIRSVRSLENNINWTLGSLPSQAGGLISANPYGTSKMHQISRN